MRRFKGKKTKLYCWLDVELGLVDIPSDNKISWLIMPAWRGDNSIVSWMELEYVLGKYTFL